LLSEVIIGWTSILAHRVSSERSRPPRHLGDKTRLPDNWSPRTGEPDTSTYTHPVPHEGTRALTTGTIQTAYPSGLRMFSII
jgi:hypothetical protein